MKDKHSAALWMFALLGLSCLLVSVDRRIFWVLASGIRHDLGLTQRELQIASEAIQLGLGVASFGAGYLVRVFNRKGLAIAGLLIASLATTWTAYAEDFQGMFAMRLVVGAGIALHVLAILTIGINRFPRHRPNVVAAVLFSMGAGALIAVNLGTIIGEATDWHETLIAFGLAGLPVAIAIFVFATTWFSEATGPQRLDNYQVQQPPARSMWSRRLMLLGVMTVLLSLCASSFRDNYLYHIREESGFTWQFGQLAVSAYAFGNLFAFYGASVFRRYGARNALITSFALTGMLSFFIFSISWQYAYAHVMFSILLGFFLGGIATVSLLSEMIDSVVTAQRGPVMGFFFGCLITPNVFSNGLCQIAESAMGYAWAGLLLMSGSAVVAAALATRLPARHRTYRRN
jgi:MFS family permease